MARKLSATLNENDYRDRVLACWLGKNIGATLGIPFEWLRQVNNVEFYTQDLGGELLANDDLDLQLAWLITLEEKGIDIDSHDLADAWLTYVTPHWAEMGVAKANLRAGIPPPLSGDIMNPCRHSCGAFIRSEIWACVAPGMPDVAAAYALEDAIVDHGGGEGTYAEIFCAAMQSAAFVVRDLREVIEIALSYIPEDSVVSSAVREAIEFHDSGIGWLNSRIQILERYRGSTAFEDIGRTSPEDQARSFHEGVVGYDAPSNMAFVVLALLEGGPDFGKVVCTAVNCGEDTDGTASTAGALFGILHGSAAIPERWAQPIGRKIKVSYLNLGELGFLGDQLPATVDELTKRVQRLADTILARYERIELRDATHGLPSGDSLKCKNSGWAVAKVAGPRHRNGLFEVTVDAGDPPTFSPDVPKLVRLTIANNAKVPMNVNLRWMLPPGWSVTPGTDARLLSPGYSARKFDFELTTSKAVTRDARGVIELSTNDRATVLYVPVRLLDPEP